MRRPSLSTVLTGLVVAASAVFVFLQFHPGLLFTNTTPAGGDMGAHVWAPAFLRDHLLPNGRITGWTHDWYAGFPALHFYFPLPSLIIVLLDVVLPYGIAFKLVTIAGLVAMPVAAWAFGRLAALPFPAPPLFAVATVPFIFDRHYTIWGGNAASTLAGEFSFSIAVSFALLFLGVLAKGIRTGRGLPLAAVLFACTALSHLLPTAFAVGAALILMLTHVAPWRNTTRRFAYIAAAGLLGTFIASFWFVPFIARLPYSNDMGWERTYTYVDNLLPFLRDDARGPMTNHLLLVFPMAAFAAVVSVVQAVRGKSRFGLALTLMALASAAAFRLVPAGPIWNARLLPFWYLTCYLLAALAFAQLAWAVAWLINRVDARRDAPVVVDDDPPEVAPTLEVVGTQGPQRVVLASVAFAGLFLAALPLGSVPFVDPPAANDSFITEWAQWNYEGYERKAAYPEYKQVIELMRRVGAEHGCGRTMWEYEPELDRLGTPMALMLLPYWTNGCIGSMEGLYFESSPTTPYHFLAVSEVSKAPSRPQRDLPYRDLDLNEGVRHLQQLGVRYYLAFSPEARAAAAEHPDLTLLDGAGPFQITAQSGAQEERLWDVYRVEDSPLVESVGRSPQPARDAGREGWLEQGLDIWQDDSVRPFATGGPVTGPGEDVVSYPEVEASNIRLNDGKVSFDVDRTGVPVIVKVSYFPNWKASGADGPWRITPNFMLVVPTSKHVELTYGYTGVDIAGWVLTFLGLASIAALVVARKRVALLLAPLSPERDAEAHEAGDGAGRALEDGGAGGPSLMDDDRDLANSEPRAFGAEDELGVEEVTAEAARGENGEQRFPPERLHPVGVRDVETESVPQHEREHRGDEAP